MVSYLNMKFGLPNENLKNFKGQCKVVRKSCTLVGNLSCILSSSYIFNVAGISRIL